MTVGINTAPLAGRDGSQLTARLVKSRLDAELVGNVSIRVLPTERPDAWEVQGRGELQLAVLVEMMRREGFELTVGKPRVLTREVNGAVHEPVDRVTIDVPDEYLGVITQLLALRKGRMEQIVNHGSGWIRLDYVVPARGLIGFRTELLTETRRDSPPAPRVRALRAVGRGDPRSYPRLARGRPRRRHDGLLAAVATGARPAVRRPGRRGLRGDDRRRERPRRRHGRQPDEGEEAHQRSFVDGGELREADPAASDVTGAGTRVHRRGRVRRGHPERRFACARSCSTRPSAAGRRSGPKHSSDGTDSALGLATAATVRTMLAVWSVAPWPAQAAADEGLTDACGVNPGWLCEATWNVTDSRLAARIVDSVVTPILTALLVVVIAALVNRYLRKLVTTFINQVTRRDKVAGAYLGKLGVGATDDERDEVRARTLSAVARTTVSAFIWTFAVLAILGIFSINLGPLIAGAGIAGIAVGLGAQQLVKDCISGFFILLEDQCAVGDEIDIGPAIGIVESITLRSTTLRDGAGTVWTVPNGTVLRIGNKSRDWSLGTVDVTVTDAAQLDDAVAVIERVAAEVSALPDVAPVLLEPIGVPGVESLGADGAVVRVTVRTPPGAQAPVMRDLRSALTRELSVAGIDVTKNFEHRNPSGGSGSIPP